MPGARAATRQPGVSRAGVPVGTGGAAWEQPDWKAEPPGERAPGRSHGRKTRAVAAPRAASYDTGGTGGNAEQLYRGASNGRVMELPRPRSGRHADGHEQRIRELAAVRHGRGHHDLQSLSADGYRHARPGVLHGHGSGHNCTDSGATLSQANAYFVRPVIGGVEQTALESGRFTLAANAPTQQYISIPITARSG